MKALSDAVHSCYQRRRTVFVIGNGGSGSNASHFCEDVARGVGAGPEREEVERRDDDAVLLGQHHVGGVAPVVVERTGPHSLFGRLAAGGAEQPARSA